MRKKRLLLNIISSFGYQLISIICGFVLPRLILTYFGSNANGLVASIAQFLGIISFLELGMGMVIQSSLYSPLANHEDNLVSEIYVSSNKFFHKIAAFLSVYVILLCFIYPKVADVDFGKYYVITLILILSINNFVQYVFGISDRLLLCADQRGYILYFAQSCTTLTNTILCIMLMRYGTSIHMLKLISAGVFMIVPIVLHIYIKKKYRINCRISYQNEPIKQKWNGVAQHISAVVLDGTDMIVLTTFSTLSNVSIYSVYYMVIKGVSQLTMSLTKGLQALTGELMAKKENAALIKLFGWSEWTIHTCTVFIFGCCSVLIVPFVSIYTDGIRDINYILPCFGILLTLANAGHCLRLPYNVIILAGGHYKQTQSCHVIAAVINIVISVMCVRKLGLIGVALGTLTAMFYQTLWMARYISHNLICWPLKRFTKQCFTDLISFIIAYLATFKIPLLSKTFLSWGILAVCVSMVWLVIIVVTNTVLYRDNMLTLYKKIRK